MNISTALLQDIIAFLTPLPCFQNENSRTALLISSGLRDLLPHFESNVTPGVFVSLVANHLDQYGEVDGKPALLLLLRGVQKTVGDDKQAMLQQFEERLNAEWSSNPSALSRQAKGQKRTMKTGLLALVLALIVVGVFFRFYSVIFPPTPQPPSSPLFTVEHPYLRPEQSVAIIAANESARRKDPLYVKWDDLIFPNAATPDPDTQTFRWTFDLKQHIQANELQNGRHALQVGFSADAFCSALNVAINTEQPIVDVAITSEAADAESITIGGIAASKLQDPEEALKIDVYLNYEDYPITFSLPVERKLDDDGRIYFEFEANVQGLPTIAADDPKYAEAFFAFKVSDQAGNEFAHAMSYAQFVAPGTQRIKANNMADIQVQKFADGPAEIGKIAFVIAPPSPLAEYRGKPAIQLSADLHGENLAQLRWVSELSQAAGHPVPTLVFRDDRHLAVVVDSDQYFDKNPPLDRDVHYKVRQFDQDGQPYDSNIATIQARETPTPPAAIVSAATPIISPTPTNTPAQEPTATNTPKPTTALLTVRSNVRDDTVFIDGEERGATPLNVELPIGRHTIRVEKMGYVSFEQALDLQAAYTLKATLETKQTPSLTDTPTPEPTPTMTQTPVPRTTHGKSQPLSRHLTPAPVPTATQTKQPEPPPTPPSSEGLEVSSSCWENETPDAICKEETTDMEFVYVSGGCFQMGCGRFDTECYDDEKPRHKICLDGFWMGRYEVTQTQWKKIMENRPSSFKGADHPVEGVPWNDAQAFLQKLNTPRPFPLPSRGFRLPTEAEWEYACRAGTQTIYSFGDNQNQLGTYAWYSENSGGETHSVGQKQQNAFGLYDMHGNVYEWVADHGMIIIMAHQ